MPTPPADAFPSRPGVLHLLHDRGGGVLSQVRDLAARSRDRYRHVLLLAGDRAWQLEEEGRRQPVRVRFGNPVTRLVRALDLQLCHVHHLGGDPTRLQRALLKTPVPWGFTLHDFLPLCPRVHAVPPGGRYCGVPQDTRVCRDCLRQAPRLRVDAARWRADQARLLRRAGFLSCPSAFLRDLAQARFPGLDWTLAPHAYQPPIAAPVPPPPPAALFTVALLGALGTLKGGERVERLAALSLARDLPLRFVVLGETLHHGGPQSLYEGRLHIHGRYLPEQLPELMAGHGVDLVAFPALGPETYGLVLDEARACGRPALVPALGALGERVAAEGGGWVVDDWADDEAWLARLCALAGDREAVLCEGRAAAALAQAARAVAVPPVVALYGRLLGRDG